MRLIKVVAAVALLTALLPAGVAGAGTTVASDGFARTVSSGWGSADAGGAYTLSGATTAFSVGGGFGNMALPAAAANRAVSLSDVSATNTSVSFKLRVSKLPTASNVYVYAALRGGPSREYRLKLRVAANGSVFLHGTRVAGTAEPGIGAEVRLAGVTLAAGQVIAVRGEAMGQTPRC